MNHTIAGAYVRERENFGSKLKEHEGVQWLLGESANLDDMLAAQLLTSVLLDNSSSPLQHALETSELIPDPAVVRANLRALGERGVLGRFDGVLVGRVAARSTRSPSDRLSSSVHFRFRSRFRCRVGSTTRPRGVDFASRRSYRRVRINPARQRS